MILRVHLSSVVQGSPLYLMLGLALNQCREAWSFVFFLCRLASGLAVTAWLTCTAMGAAFAACLQCQPSCGCHYKACFCHANIATSVPVSCLACMHACMHVAALQQAIGQGMMHSHAPHMNMDMQPPIPLPPACRAPALTSSDAPHDCLLQYMVLYQCCLSIAQNISFCFKGSRLATSQVSAHPSYL